MSHLIKKFISSIPIEIVAILLIIAIPAIGVTVLSNKISKNFTNYVSKASPSPSLAEIPSPSPIADLKSISNSLSKSPSVLGESTDNSSPIVVGTQTYSTLSLSELVNMNGANNQAIAAVYDAYNTFLQTPNLQYMTPPQQQQIFTPILTAAIQKSLDLQKAKLQQQIDAMNQQLNAIDQQQYSNPPSSTQYYNQPSGNYQNCLNDKVASINSNPFLSESIRLSRIEKAKQDCANQ